MAGYMGKQRNEGKVCSLEAIHSGAWEARRNPGFTHVDRHESMRIIAVSSGTRPPAADGLNI